MKVHRWKMKIRLVFCTDDTIERLVVCKGCVCVCVALTNVIDLHADTSTLYVNREYHWCEQHSQCIGGDQQVGVVQETA